MYAIEYIELDLSWYLTFRYSVHCFFLFNFFFSALSSGMICSVHIYYWKVTEHSLVLEKNTGNVVWRFYFWGFAAPLKTSYHYTIPYPYRVLTFVYHPCQGLGFFYFSSILRFLLWNFCSFGKMECLKRYNL